MFKKTLFAATVVALCSASALSQAQEAQPYLFASLGQSDADLSTGDVVPSGLGLNSSMDNKDTAWKIGAGLKLNQYFAFEAEYVDLGEVSFRATDGNNNLGFNAGTEGYGLNGVLTMPLDSFSLFAKLGYHRLETDFDLSVNGFDVISDSQTEWVTSFGVGGGYNLGERVTLVAEFERYRDVGDEYDVDLLSAGIRYNF